MVKAFKAKLNNRGSGILYAMLVLLVVAAISAIVVTGAVVNTSRTENRVKEEQLYLAAESACDILANDWHGNLGSAFAKSKGEWIRYWATDVKADDGETRVSVPYSGYFQVFAKAALTGAPSPFSRSNPKRFSVSIAGAENDETDNSNFSGISITGELFAPDYSEYEPSGTGFPEAKDLTVKCIVTASYGEESRIPPYKMVMTLTAITQNNMFEGTVAYINWIVADIAPYQYS